MATPAPVTPEPRQKSRQLPASCWVLTATLVVIVGAAGALSVLQLAQPSRREQQFFPRLDADQVTYLSQASRGKLRWLKRYDETGSETKARAVEVPRYEQNFERLILTLLPIRDEKAVALRVPDYEITIMTGNRGVSIRIGFKSGVDDGEMLVEHHGRFYSGGNSADFKAIAEALLPKPEGVDPVPKETYTIP